MKRVHDSACKGRENLENAKEAIEKYEKEYQWDMEDIRRQEL